MKCIEIRCCIPFKHRTLIEAELQQLLTRCSWLVYLTVDAVRDHHSPMLTSPSRPLLGLFSRPWVVDALPSALDRITTLVCSDTVLYGHLVTLLPLCKSLQALTFHIPPPVIALISPTHYTIHLDHLQSLKIIFDSCSTNEWPPTSDQWFLPTLQEVSINKYRSSSVSNISVLYCDRFFQQYGHTLRYLHICRIGAFGPVSIDIQHVLWCCPSLEHLVISPAIKSTTSINHPSIMWIDVWDPAYLTEAENHRIIQGMLTQQAFPTLRGVRELDHDLPHEIEWSLLLA